LRDLFPGYYRPTEEEFDKLWKDCIFIFDANMLLHVYRYSSETRDRFIQVLTRLKDRLWIPHQAAYEFHRNRLLVITHQRKTYDDIEKILTDAIHKVEKYIEGIRHHPVLEPRAVLTPLNNAKKKVLRYLAKTRAEHPDLLSSDKLLEDLSSLFAGKVGSPYSDERLREIYKEGARRYENKVPPGYMDKDKPGDEKYGDLELLTKPRKCCKLRYGKTTAYRRVVGGNRAALAS
jgi:hypothetical protein